MQLPLTPTPGVGVERVGVEQTNPRHVLSLTPTPGVGAERPRGWEQNAGGGSRTIVNLIHEEEGTVTNMFVDFFRESVRIDLLGNINKG